MADDTLLIYVWADKTWVSEEDVDDLDWYIISGGKSDDFKEYEVSAELEPDDIQELIDLNALPGMLPDIPTVKNIEDMGKVAIPEGAVLMIYHEKDINYNALTILKGKMIINAPNIFIEVIMPKEDTDE